MPVLVEAINVIVRNETIEEKYPGGLGSYWVDSPNRSMCSDDHVTRVGFLALDTFREFIDRLMELGFRFVEDDELIDIAVFDQEEGMLRPCRWLHVADHPDGFQYAALWGDLGDVIEKPVGWRFEGSIAERGRSENHEIFDEVDVSPDQGFVPEFVELVDGHIYVLFTPDGNFAKIHVKAVSENSVTFDWAYQIDPDNPELAPPLNESVNRHGAQ